MFRPSYLKEGPGIAKDAPEKTGAAWVGETLVREFWHGSSCYGALHGQYGA